LIRIHLPAFHDITSILPAFAEKVNKEKTNRERSFLQLFNTGANSLDKDGF